MGENGAGKSTLMKVIAGVHTADSGKVFLDNKEIEISSPAKALRTGNCNDSSGIIIRA